MTTDSRALLEGKKLLSTEGLVVDLGSGFDEILQVGAGQEIAEIDEFTMVLILHYESISKCCFTKFDNMHTVDNAPSVLAAADLLSIHNDGLLRSNNGKRKDTLCNVSTPMKKSRRLELP